MQIKYTKQSLCVSITFSQLSRVVIDFINDSRCYSLL